MSKKNKLKQKGLKMGLKANKKAKKYWSNLDKLNKEKNLDSTINLNRQIFEMCNTAHKRVKKEILNRPIEKCNQLDKQKIDIFLEMLKCELNSVKDSSMLYTPTKQYLQLVYNDIFDDLNSYTNLLSQHLNLLKENNEANSENT